MNIEENLTIIFILTIIYNFIFTFTPNVKNYVKRIIVSKDISYDKMSNISKVNINVLKNLHIRQEYIYISTDSNKKKKE